jgi:AraC family transcriptional regulator of adaptative response/methylated-DNA-[protein]-cysteine methyltransferase
MHLQPLQGEIMTTQAALRRFDASTSERDPQWAHASARDAEAATRETDRGIRFVVGRSSLGLVLVARSDAGITAVLIGDDGEELRRDLQDRFPNTDLADGDAELQGVAAQVIAAIESPARTLDLPLDLRGTEFQRRVWQALRRIPVGSTATYTEIAMRLGLPKSARAVAQACAANALAVLIPCHRVVRSDGELAGYRWGIERKRALLDREAHV